MNAAIEPRRRGVTGSTLRASPEASCRAASGCASAELREESDDPNATGHALIGPALHAEILGKSAEPFRS